MKSTRQKIEQCSGLIDTTDVTPWESQFLKDLWEKMPGDAGTSPRLSDKQLDVLDRIYNKHFA